MAKHRVEIINSFQVSMELGALMIGDKEVSPARVHTTSYKEGEIVTFNRKPDMESFLKIHSGKCRYIGVVPPKTTKK